MFTDALLDRPVSDCKLVFLDIETTGLDHTKCHIIEVAAVEIRGGQEGARFTSLVKPVDPNQQATLFGKPAATVPPEITRITGITKDMLEGAPEFEEVCPRLLAALGDAVVVAHNAEFDISFLAHRMEKMGVPRPKNEVLDTLRISRALDRSASSHSMDFLKRKYAVTSARSHRALEDTLALAQVFAKFTAQIPCPAGPLKLRDLVKLHGAPLEFRVYASARS